MFRIYGGQVFFCVTYQTSKENQSQSRMCHHIFWGLSRCSNQNPRCQKNRTNTPTLAFFVGDFDVFYYWSALLWRPICIVLHPPWGVGSADRDMDSVETYTFGNVRLVDNRGGGGGCNILWCVLAPFADSSIVLIDSAFCVYFRNYLQLRTLFPPAREEMSEAQPMCMKKPSWEVSLIQREKNAVISKLMTLYQELFISKDVWHVTQPKCLVSVALSSIS